MDRGPTRKLDLNLLRVFDAIYVTHSITQAAHRVGLTQPAVSNALGRLRSAFNDRLFVKTSLGMSPTPLACEIHPIARATLETLTNIVERNDPFDPAACHGTFHLAMTDYGSSVLLPRIVKRVGERAPQVTIRVRRLHRNAVVDELSAGEVDLVFSSDLPSAADIYAKRLYEDHFVGMVGQGNRSIGDHLGLEDLASNGHVLFTPQDGHRGVVAELLDRHGLPHRTVVYTTYGSSIPGIVHDTDLITIIPEKLAESFAEQWNIRLLPLAVEIPGITMYQYWHLRTKDDPANAWLRREIQALFEEPSST